MLKTTKDKIATPSIPLILLGGLIGYTTRPFYYLFKILTGIRPIMNKIDKKYPKDLRKICALMISIYSVFKKKLEKEKALSLVKAVSIPFGLSVQMANFRYVEEERNIENLIKYQKRTNQEGPTRLNKMEIISESNDSYTFTINNDCCFFNVFSKLGMPELTTVLCEIDNAIFNVYSPDKIIFHRNGINNRIADGASKCQFYCTTSF